MANGKYHKIKKGECLSSVAEQNGIFWESLWIHVENDELRNLRKDPNILFPGDRVFIPEKTKGSFQAATESRHRFRRKGIPVLLRLRFVDGDGPRDGIPYLLKIGGKLISGQTDSDGFLEEAIPVGVESATLRLGEGDEAENYDLELGCLDPLDTDDGVRERLENLGFASPDDEECNLPLALSAFQASRDIEVTGEIDADTIEALGDEYGY